MASISGTVIGVRLNEHGEGEVSVCGEDGNIYSLELTAEVAEQLDIIQYGAANESDHNHNLLSSDLSMPSTTKNSKNRQNTLFSSANPVSAMPSTSKNSTTSGTLLLSDPEVNPRSIPNNSTGDICSLPPQSSSFRAPTHQETVPENRGKKSWTRNEIKCLLIEYKEQRDKMESTSYKNDAVWDIISKKMVDSGFPNNSSQCKFKFNALKRKYTATKDNNRKSGAARADFEFMEEFDELFDKDYSVIPPLRAESNRIEPVIRDTSNSAVRMSSESDDIDLSPATAVTRRRRITITESIITEMQKMSEARVNWHEERKAERRAEQEVRNRHHSEIVAAISDATQVYKEAMTKLIDKL